MQRLLRARELSAETGIPVSTLHHWAKADRIPHVRIDGFVRFPEHEVEAWIRERTRGGEATEGRSA
jgi:excisionase family DNA binding protein